MCGRWRDKSTRIECSAQKHNSNDSILFVNLGQVLDIEAAVTLNLAFPLWNRVTTTTKSFIYVLEYDFIDHELTSDRSPSVNYITA